MNPAPALLENDASIVAVVLHDIGVQPRSGGRGHEQGWLSGVSVSASWRLKMSLKSPIAAIAIVLSATTGALAQSQPYCGPNAPVGNTFGTPPTGTLAGQRGAELCRSYHFRRHADVYHHRHGRHYSYR
jgi:hypothetical protein